MMLDILIVLLHFIKIAVLLDISSNIDLAIQKVDKNHITFICSCKSPPYGQTVEILINSVSVASITFLQHKCYIQRRPCNAGECACKSTQFNMTLMIPDQNSYSLTCQVRELQEQHGRHLKLLKTITLNGTDVVNETIYIERIRISNSDSTNGNITIISGSTENTNIHIIIGTLVPVAVVFIIAFYFFSKYFKKDLTKCRKRKELRMILNTDIAMEEHASSIHDDLSNDCDFTDYVNRDTSKASLRSYKTYASFKAQNKEIQDAMESNGSNSEEEYLTGNEDAENDSLLTDDNEWNKQIDYAQKGLCNPGTSGAAVLLDENTLDTSNGSIDTTTTSSPINPIMAVTTEHDADIIYQRCAPDKYQ